MKTGTCIEIIQMLTCTVKPEPKAQKFQLISIQSKHEVKVEGSSAAKDFTEWVQKLQGAILASLNANVSNKSKV